MRFLRNGAILAAVSLAASEVNALPECTNGLWLQVTNISNGSMHAGLKDAKDFVYEVFSTTNLATAGVVSGWDIETELFPSGNTNLMPFDVLLNGRSSLFLRARDWTGVTHNSNKTPDWWLYYWFGIEGLSLSDTKLDSQGSTLLSDYQNNADPNEISFAVMFTERHVKAAGKGTIKILSGQPFYEAILVNDRNESDALWQPFTSADLAVKFGPTNGLYSVLIGLRGLPTMRDNPGLRQHSY